MVKKDVDRKEKIKKKKEGSKQSQIMRRRCQKMSPNLYSTMFYMKGKKYSWGDRKGGERQTEIIY